MISEKEVKYGNPVKLTVKDSFSTVVTKNSPAITQKVLISPDIKAPINKGDILGKLEFYQGDKKMGTVDLTAAYDVKRKIYTLWWFWPLIILLALYIPFRTIVGIRRYKRHKHQVRYISYIKRYR